MHSATTMPNAYMPTRAMIIAARTRTGRFAVVGCARNSTNPGACGGRFGDGEGGRNGEGGIDGEGGGEGGNGGDGAPAPSRGPQSSQSVPNGQALHSEPAPPSSQAPSPPCAKTHSFEQSIHPQAGCAMHAIARTSSRAHQHRIPVCDIHVQVGRFLANKQSVPNQKNSSRSSCSQM